MQSELTSGTDFYEKVLGDVAVHGQSLMCVAAGRGSFMYTIGNALLGLPELLLIGTVDPRLAPALNILGERMRFSKKPLEEGLSHIPGGPFPFKIRKAGLAAQMEYTIQVDRALPVGDYQVLQVMFCDRFGKYPDEEGCEAQYVVPLP